MSPVAEGFRALEARPEIGLVLMDMMMPEIDGFEATRRLRADPRYRELPIIALTAKTMPGDMEATLRAGCNAFVSKPVAQDHLIEVVATWLAPKEAT